MTREGVARKTVGNGMIDLDKEDCTVSVGRGMTREGMTHKAVGNGMTRKTAPWALEGG